MNLKDSKKPRTMRAKAVQSTQEMANTAAKTLHGDLDAVKVLQDEMFETQSALASITPEALMAMPPAQQVQYLWTLHRSNEQRWFDAWTHYWDAVITPRQAWFNQTVGQIDPMVAMENMQKHMQSMGQDLYQKWQQHMFSPMTAK